MSSFAFDTREITHELSGNEAVFTFIDNLAIALRSSSENMQRLLAFHRVRLARQALRRYRFFPGLERLAANTISSDDGSKTASIWL